MNPRFEEDVLATLARHEARLTRLELELLPDEEPPPPLVLPPSPKTPLPVVPPAVELTPAPVYGQLLARRAGRDQHTVKAPEPAAEPALITPAEEPALVASAPQPVPPPMTPPAPDFSRDVTPPQPWVAEAQPFLTQEEFSAPPVAKVPPMASVPEVKKSLEERIGTTWLLRVGGVLIMLGAAWGAVRLESAASPAMRMVMGYLLAAVIGGVGQFVRRRNENVGRAGIGIALALGYFVSYASHFIGRMDIGLGTPWLALGGMALFASAIVGLAERWRSEVLAGFGLCLALIPALMSAQEDSGFSLLAIMGLGLASGVLLLRNGWMRLTSLAVVLVYTAITTVAMMGRFGGGPVAFNPLNAIVAALVQHLIFAAAFLRWSRAWLARERAFDQLEGEAVPAGFAPGILPWGRGFDILNTLALVTVVMLVAGMTATPTPGLLWTRLHWLLAPMAVLEFLRLTTRAGRDPQLGAFHSITGASLLTAAGVWALDGASESLVLALGALALTVAGSQSWQLRWLRMVSALPASLAMVGVFKSAMASPTLELGTALTPIVLLISGLPFQQWLTKGFSSSDSKALRVLSILAAQYRSLLASLVIIVLAGHYLDGIGRALAPMALAMALLVGIRGLKATAWTTAAVASTVASVFFLTVFGSSPELFLPASVGLAALAVIWSKRFTAPAHPVMQALDCLMMTGCAIAFALWQMNGVATNGVPWMAPLLVPTLMLLAIHPTTNGLLGGRALVRGPLERIDGVIAATLIALILIPLLWVSSVHGRELPLVAAVLIALISVLGTPARRWWLGVLGALFIALAQAAVQAYGMPLAAVIPVLLATFVAVAMIDVVLRRFAMEPTLPLLMLFAAPATAVFGFTVLEVTAGWSSLALLAIAAAMVLPGWLMARRGDGRPNAALVTAGGAAAISVALALVVDAPISMIPALILSALCTAAWVIGSLRNRLDPLASVALHAAAIAIAALGILIHEGLAPGVPLAIGLIGVGFHIGARLIGRGHESFLGSLTVIGAIVLNVVDSIPHAAPWNAWSGLALGGMALWLSRQRNSEAGSWNEGQRLALLIGAVTVSLFALGGGGLLPKALSTAAWGAMATGLLVGGFALRDSAWRRTAIAIFGLAVLRLLVIDLANSDMNARILACLVVGILMVGSAYLYGFLSRRFLSDGK